MTSTQRQGDSPQSHLAAVLQALLVTFLWSTSYVLIKWGLEDIPPLTFAGLRYSLAALVLLPFVVLDAGARSALKGMSKPDAMSLALLGLVFYAATQGAQVLGLALLPATVVSLLLGFTPVVVALGGGALLGETTSWRQWVGIAVFLGGVLVYFLPLQAAVSLVGLGVMSVGVLANAWGGILGRRTNRSGRLPPLVVTLVSMTVGGVLLLGTGLARDGVPSLERESWLLVGWLAVVNTAAAFTLWNHTLKRLTAIESSILNNTMLIQIAILAWVFLGEPLGWRRGAGITLAALGACVVQVGRAARPRRA